MSRINTVIQPRAFEIIRDRLGTILADELANQFTTFNVQEANVYVTVEGDKIVDSTEMSTIIVALNEDDFDSEHAGSARGKMLFNVDAFCKAKSTDSVDGAVLSAFKLQRLIGLCYAIIKSAFYDTLGFTPGFIANVSIRKVKIGDPSEKDMVCTIQGRMFVEVTAIETTDLFVPTLITGYQTTITIGSSSSGYLYSPTPPAP